MTTSLSVNPIQIVKVIDKRLDIEHPRQYGVYQGAISSDIHEITASGNASTSQLGFSFQNANVGTAIDRTMYVRYSLQFTFIGVGVGSPSRLFSGYGESFALRSYPLSRNIKTANLKINNTSVTTNVSDIFNAFSWVYNKDVRSKYIHSSTPTYLDQDQSYNSLTASVRNPLGAYGNSSNEESEKRGAYSEVYIVADDGQSGIINVEVTEPLFVSPLTYGYSDHSALYHVNSIDLNILFNSNMATNFWSAAFGPTYTNFTSISCTVWKQPTLLVTQLSVPNLLRPQKSIDYQYNDIYTQVQNTNMSLAPGQSQIITLNSVQLQNIPRRMYLFFQRNENTKSIYTTDTFARISNVQVLLGSIPQLAAASPQQLYQMSVKNGIDMTYAQWFGSIGQSLPTIRKFHGVGSVLSLEFGKDICINSDVEAVGILKNDQLRVSATITNLHPTESINFWSYMLLVSDGVITLDSSMHTTVQNAVITKQDVLNSKDAPIIQSSENEISGGSFFGTLKGLIKSIPSAVRAVWPTIQKIAPYAEKFIEGLGIEGDGCPVCEGMGDGIVGGCAHCGCGCDAKGGKMVSRRKLNRFK